MNHASPSESRVAPFSCHVERILTGSDRFRLLTGYGNFSDDFTNPFIVFYLNRIRNILYF